jgi:hypothetical protein
MVNLSLVEKVTYKNNKGEQIANALSVKEIYIVRYILDFVPSYLYNLCQSSNSQRSVFTTYQSLTHKSHSVGILNPPK